MRARAELEVELRGDANVAGNYSRASVDLQRLTLEVMLDVRDLLTPPPVLPAPENKKGILRR